MAFNLAALKGLFGKLMPAAKSIANYGDDVANVVANYGDDVAGVVANYGDDAAKALTTYGDDVARTVDSVDDFTDPNWFPDFKDTPPVRIDPATGKSFTYPLGTSDQDVLKRNLMDKHLPTDGVTAVDLVEFPAYAARRNAVFDPWSDPDMTPVPPRSVTALGDYLNDVPTLNSVAVPELDTKGLVVQADDLNVPWRYDELGYGLRPHRNTKLGKWFSQQMPNYGFEVDIDDNPFK